ncbi:hypothetical protein MUY27_04185 [Mucilaginibacter sp. RS28]|uniref:Uncharacterized protein n=1 Tax=Mucilaginibacter straminoryzae TaxID=2932774 RepID=A0A9X1X582_9SPHI|nr:hypothetical protein [Mucilaginibacter straminoryzae]MCJ8208894.1 hypothetical protein [Mucilaginibacter straminoryzae]
MKTKNLLITAIILFLITNTSYYWESWCGIFLIPLTLILIIVFLVLVVKVVFRLFSVLKGGLSRSQEMTHLIVSILLLTICVVKPAGIINFESMEGEDVLVASREGVANCFSTLKLKKDGCFYFKSICFGVEKAAGNYAVKGDTVMFKWPGNRGMYFIYGILDPDSAINGTKNSTHFLLYKTRKDTTPYMLLVVKNKLVNLKSTIPPPRP